MQVEKGANFSRPARRSKGGRTFLKRRLYRRTSAGRATRLNLAVDSDILGVKSTI